MDVNILMYNGIWYIGIVQTRPVHWVTVKHDLKASCGS